MATISIHLKDGPILYEKNNEIVVFKDGIQYGSAIAQIFIPNEKILMLDVKGRLQIRYHLNMEHDKEAKIW